MQFSQFAYGRSGAARDAKAAASQAEANKRMNPDRTNKPVSSTRRRRR